MSAPTCPEHGLIAILVPDSTIYGGTSYGGKVWKCPEPTCDRYVGAHAKGHKPKGTLADKALRALRIKAHEEFDRWWKETGLSRKDGYQALADRLGVEEAHIGEMDAQECGRVIAMFQEPRL